MHKDIIYHKSAIQYNEELADFAEALSDKLEHEEVARWARSVSKQHRFHAGRHKKALSKLQTNGGFTTGVGTRDDDQVDLETGPPPTFSSPVD